MNRIVARRSAVAEFFGLSTVKTCACVEATTRCECRASSSRRCVSGPLVADGEFSRSFFVLCCCCSPQSENEGPAKAGHREPRMPRSLLARAPGAWSSGQRPSPARRARFLPRAHEKGRASDRISSKQNRETLSRALRTRDPGTRAPNTRPARGKTKPHAIDVVVSRKATSRRANYDRPRRVPSRDLFSDLGGQRPSGECAAFDAGAASTVA